MGEWGNVLGGGLGGLLGGYQRGHAEATQLLNIRAAEMDAMRAQHMQQASLLMLSPAMTLTQNAYTNEPLPLLNSIRPVTYQKPPKARAIVAIFGIVRV